MTPRSPTLKSHGSVKCCQKSSILAKRSFPHAGNIIWSSPLRILEGNKEKGLLGVKEGNEGDVHLSSGM